MDASRGWRGLSHGVPDRAQRIPASPPAPPDPACGEGRLYLSNALPDRAQRTPAGPVSPAHKSDAPAALLAGMAVWKTSNTLPDRAQRTHAGPATKSEPTQAPTESVANPRTQGFPQILGADPATAGSRRSDSQILARVVSLLYRCEVQDMLLPTYAQRRGLAGMRILEPTAEEEEQKKAMSGTAQAI